MVALKSNDNMPLVLCLGRASQATTEERPSYAELDEAAGILWPGKKLTTSAA
jgi:hypothetical protein